MGARAKVWALDVMRSWEQVGGSAFGIWAEWGGGAYLGLPFLCPPGLSALGIPYALWWVFSPVYTIFWVLVVLVGIHMASWDWRWEVAQGDVVAVFCRWSVSGCVAGWGYALGA